MLGIELETDKFDGDVNPTRFARFLHQKFSDRVYCKHDGSLDNGVEIVSHPAPLRYHMRKFGWADILGTADECGRTLTTLAPAAYTSTLDALR